MAILLVHPFGQGEYTKQQVLDCLRTEFKDGEFLHVSTDELGREHYFVDSPGPPDDTYLEYEITGRDRFTPRLSKLLVHIGTRIPRDLKNV